MWLIANTLHTECHQLTHLPLLRFTLVGPLIPFSHAGFTVVVKSLYTLHNGHECNRKLACNDFFELFFFHGTSVMTSKKKNWVHNFYFGFSLVHTGTKAYRQVKYIHEFT